MLFWENFDAMIEMKICLFSLFSPLLGGVLVLPGAVGLRLLLVGGIYRALPSRYELPSSAS